MPTTSKGLPYPSDFDQPAVPSDIGALAIAVDALLNPVGTIVATGASTVPTGWFLCNGQAVSRTTYSALFNAIGTAFGTGDGSTTFNVPNLLGRVPVGRDGAQTEFDVLGESGGSKTHSHTNTGLSTESAGDHYHSVDPPNTGTSGYAHAHSGPSHTHDFNPNNVSTGSGGSHSHASLLVVASGGTSTTYAANDTSAGSHTHSVAIGTGTTTSAGTGGTSTDSHSHTVDIGAFNSATTGAHTHGRGASDTQSNLSPYLVVNYLIKF